MSLLGDTLDTAGNIITGDILVPDKKVVLSSVLLASGWGKDAPQAKLVVLAESGGDATIINPTPCSQNGDHAVGLFQMCTVHAGKLGIPPGQAAATKWLKNPYNNARAAHALFKAAGNSFDSDWSSSKSKWGKGVATNDDPVVSTDKQNLLDPAPLPGGINPLDGIQAFLSALMNPSTYLRAGKGLLGGVLVVVGTGALVFVVANKAGGSNVGRAARRVATAVPKP